VSAGGTLQQEHVLPELITQFLDKERRHTANCLPAGRARPSSMKAARTLYKKVAHSPSLCGTGRPHASYTAGPDLRADDRLKGTNGSLQGTRHMAHPMPRFRRP
jgi:hypothetical protein